MTEYKIKLIEVGSDFDSRESGKTYVTEGGMLYEVQQEGERLGDLAIRALKDIAKPELQRMRSLTLKIVLQIEEERSLSGQ